MPALTDRLAVGPDVLVRPIGDESVLLNVKTETYFGLDALGTRVWTVLVGGASIQEALDTLLAEYAVSEPELRADITDLIDELIRHQLVAVAPVDHQDTDA
jgi:coenzyme PQQ synthesis protein D (PqqD)